MGSLVTLFGKLRLRVNEAKSAVDRAWSRPFLGFAFWVASGRQVSTKVAREALDAMKDRVRKHTKRTRGRSLKSITEELGQYLRGWKAYFRIAATPGVFRLLDEWIRHRLRAYQLKAWKRGTTVFRELTTRGLSARAAAKVASNTRRWWHNSAMAIHIALPNKLFDQMGVPRLAS